MKKVILSMTTVIYMIFNMVIITMGLKNFSNIKLYIIGVIYSTIIYSIVIIVISVFYNAKHIKASKGKFNNSLVDDEVNELYNNLYECYSQSLAEK